MLNDLLKSLTEENEKQMANIDRLTEDLSKQDELANELNEKKIELQNETSVLKARFNCIKKEVEMRKTYLAEIINKSIQNRPEDLRLKNINFLVEKISKLTSEINLRTNTEMLGLLSEKVYKFN
jgi:hypothetical protein